MSHRLCNAVSPQCPVEATIYGYAPALGEDAALLAVFGVLTILQLGLLAKYRLWAYSLAIGAGCALECVGYGGRLMMNHNPWSDTGFKIQIVCLIFAPSFVAGGLYLTFKHLIRYLGPEYSRLKPELYTWIFIGCDLISIILQAVGGGISASASKGSANFQNILNIGNRTMIAGIAFQVATMGVCGLFALDFAFRYWRNTKSMTTTGGTRSHPFHGNTKALCFCGAVVLAFILVLIRCIYRLPEMAGGWGNPLMRNEKDFLILDGLMIALAGICLTVFYPGYFFPTMMNNRVHARKSSEDVQDPTPSTSPEKFA